MKLFLRLNILISILLFSSIITKSNAQEKRIIVGVNDNWQFHLGGIEYADEPSFDDTKWQQVALPHTWNATDPFDDDGTYVRGIGWYRRTIDLDDKYRNKKVFLCFEGANQVTEVYVNGAFVGRHKGGYTAFSFDITSNLKWDQNKSKNVIAIQVNNAHDNFIPPLSFGYALYGGIYRNMWVIATDSLHFKEINNSSGDVFLTTPGLNKQSASLNVKAIVVNESGKNRTFYFTNTIFDKEGKQFTRFSKEITVGGGRQTQILTSSDELPHPHLWSPEDPYLYHVCTQLIEGGKVIDEVTNPLGFRWFRFSADSGFFLNGKKYVLHGVNRHQDIQGKGSALSDEDHIRDMHLIKDMGANFLRLAHYPQASAVLNLADQLGIIIWEEDPLVNYMNVEPEFLSNAETMLREMIHQHFNHPSIVMWGSMNEILLDSKDGDRIQKHSDTAYLKGVRKFALKLDSLIREEDPSRYTTMAMHVSDDYAKYRLDNISQVAGQNVYSGWYGGITEDFGIWLDKLHKEKPDQIIFISEYGAGSDQRLNTSNPIRLDFSGQYQRYYHESYIRQMNSCPFLAGTAIWNQFDFSQPNIGGPMSNLNNKGMMTWDRKYKDVYFLYKVNWNPEPMIYIATRDWLRRAGNVDTNFPLDVYANTNDVTLYVNGKKESTIKPDDIHKCSFNIQFRDGDNLIEAIGKQNGKTIKDAVIIHYSVYPKELTGEGGSLYINVGSNAQYTDESGMVWLQDQPYKKGSYGYLSGVPSTVNLKYVIKNTLHVPLCYSYLENVKAYRIDVPNGTYTVDLYFAEPLVLQKGERVFDVSINKEKLIDQLDLTASQGFCVTVKKTFVVKVVNGDGLEISFNALKGNPVLNGIKVAKQ